MVGAELQPLVGRCVAVGDATERVRVGWNRMDRGQNNRMIRPQAGGGVERAGVAAREQPVALGAHHQEGGTEREDQASLAIEGTAIQDVARARRGQHFVADVDVVPGALGNADQRGEVAVQLSQSRPRFSPATPFKGVCGVSSPVFPNCSHRDCPRLGARGTISGSPFAQSPHSEAASILLPLLLPFLFHWETPLVPREIRSQHSFRSADLSIWVDGNLVYQDELTGVAKRRLLFRTTVQGSFSEVLRVPAGKRLVRVRVRSESEGYDQTRESAAEFRENRAQRLVLGFDGGSRDLILSWNQ